MPRAIPPHIVEKIRRKEQERREDKRVPLYLPDDHTPTKNEREPEETSGIYIIDLVD